MKGSEENLIEVKSALERNGPEIRSDLMDAIDDAYKVYVRNGDRKKTRRKLENHLDMEYLGDLAFDICVTRKKAGTKFHDGNRLFFTSDGLRWATPESAAEHCAKRLLGDFTADLTCGQGGQVLSLVNKCEKVLAVEKDPINMMICRMNIEARGIENVETYRGDCLSVEAVSLFKDGGYVFSDPSRPPGSRERDLYEIEPDPRDIMERYGNLASGFCFEVPPYIMGEKITFDCEAEYVSIEGRLNRLNLYTDDLKTSEVSAVSLPSGERISGMPRDLGTGDSNIRGPWIYEVDNTVVKSGLSWKLLEGISGSGQLIPLDERRTLLSTNERQKSDFLIGSFKFVDKADESDLIDKLKKLDAGSVTLRWKIDPRRYWDVRNRIEGELSGKRRFHLFKKKGYLILEKNGDD